MYLRKEKNMIISNEWKDYEILDMANGEKLERWGNIILIRPDPQIIWSNKSKPELWKNAHAHYHRSKTGGGQWEYLKKIPESWQIKYKDLTFNLKPMGFKHTGLFPEQAANWDFMINKIKKAGRPIRVLNLFAYTGGASVACSYAGASVCHRESRSHCAVSSPLSRTGTSRACRHNSPQWALSFRMVVS